VFSTVQSYNYDSYGNPTLTPASGPMTDFRYAGMLYHADSGLYLTQYRAYDPRTGRWLSRDPIEEAGGVNLYAYVDANPINYYDSLGLCAADPNKCKNLAEKIEALRNELAKRSYDLKVDKLNLPPTGPSMTIESHEDKFEEIQDALEDRLNEYNKQGCGPGFPIPSDAWKYATMPTPQKGQSTMDAMPDSPVIKVPWWAPVVPFIPWIIRGAGAVAVF
jgi:RHS repeat-associated protein